MNDRIQINILLFATLKQKAGEGQLKIEIERNSTINDLKKKLGDLYPPIKENLKTALYAINREYALDNEVIPENADVAIFPPVSGGSHLPTVLKVTDQALDLDTLIPEITLSTTGAICMFTGTVRGDTRRGEAHSTIYLEYEAYLPMAEEKMGQVADEIRSRWPSVEGIVIVQRIGRLDPGTPTVLIACSAAHRETGVFEAARYGIDRLKEIVPIWKKEVGPNGEFWVEGDYHPEKGD